MRVMRKEGAGWIQRKSSTCTPPLSYVVTTSWYGGGLGGFMMDYMSTVRAQKVVLKPPAAETLLSARERSAAILPST